MIVYMNDSYTVTTGIEAGIGDEPIESKGKVFPGIELQFGSESINNLLNSFNGFGSFNIGQVTPNFYLNLKALESQGLIDISSTPKLSTLNGHEATMSIGNTEYYLEERTDLFGAQNPQLTTTSSYKAVDAELSINIKPIVSGDNQITLEIEVNQSDFTARISKYAPPGKTSRKFKSMIRVRDQEMVLLGGLEEKKKSDTASGVPFLSRIPIVKWFFSSRSKVNATTRLNVFIKPTIIN
jgi:type IV pilus assembly protein PilQ